MPTGPGFSRAFRWAVASLVVGVSIFGIRVAASNGADDPGAAQRPSSTADIPQSEGIESEYGIRIQRVSVIGDGGIVEIRYQLIDADLADVIHQDTVEYGDEFPQIIAENITLSIPTFHHHGGDLVTGREFSILYANADGSIQPGDVVTVKIGDEQLDLIPVS